MYLTRFSLAWPIGIYCYVCSDGSVAVSSLLRLDLSMSIVLLLSEAAGTLQPEFVLYKWPVKCIIEM